MTSVTQGGLVALSGDGRFVAIRNPDTLRVVDASERALLDEIELGEPSAFALVREHLYIATGGQLLAYALPSLDVHAVDLDEDVGAQESFLVSPTGRALVLAGATAVAIDDDGMTLTPRRLPLPDGAVPMAVVDAGHVWALLGNELVLVDGAGATLQTVRFAATETVVGAAVLSAKPALAVLLREEDHDTLLTLDATGERLARAKLPTVTLMRVADKRLLAVLATGPRSLSAIDLRYCRNVAATETATDVADVACAADASSFVVAGTPGAGELQVRQLGYREMFQPSWPGQDELLRSEKPQPAPQAGAPTPAPRTRPAPKLASVPIRAVDDAPRPITDEAAEGDLGKLVTYARRILSGEKQPRRPAHPGLEALLQRYALDDVDAAILVLAAAPHLDPALRDDVARARGEGDQVDGALALRLAAGARLAGDGLERLDDTAPLVRHGLVRLLPPPLARAPSLAEHELFPSGRTLATLRGAEALDPLVAALATRLDCAREDATGVVAAEELSRVAQLCGAALTAGTHALVVSAAELAPRRLLRGVAATLGYAELLTADVARLPLEPLPLDEVLAELCHEASHREMPLVIENLSAWRHDELLIDRLRAALERLSIAIWATSDRELRPLAAVLPLRIDLTAPDEDARAEAWQLESGQAGVTLSKKDVTELARRTLGRAQIAEACRLGAALARNASQAPSRTHVDRALAALQRSDTP
jgi:hypothetical protein